MVIKQITFYSSITAVNQGGLKSVMTALTQGGWGEQNHGKHADLIPECFLIVAFLITQVWCQ